MLDLVSTVITEHPAMSLAGFIIACRIYIAVWSYWVLAYKKGY